MTDAELWKDILRSNESAWRQLIARYEPLVYAVATRSGLSFAEAADCFQQTWTNLFKSRRKLKDPERISAWLVTTAKREAIRLLKRRTEMQEDDQYGQAPDKSPLPDVELEQLQLRNHVQWSLKQIDGRCQTLIKLLFYAPEDMSYEQVAEKLGISANALGPARKRCLERLKKILDKNGILDALN